MRIASRSFSSGAIDAKARAFLFAVILGGSAFGVSQPCMAADQVPAIDVPSVSSAASPAPSVDQDATKRQNSEIEKSLVGMEDKITENAKSAVKKLNTASETTFADLNVARQTISRIDAMIDVEKRLGELERLRGEREARASAAIAAISPSPAVLAAQVPMAAAIPASALAPPSAPGSDSSGGSNGSSSHSDSGSSKSSSRSSADVDVARITGTDGRYTAFIKFSDGESRTVKVGDPVAAGENVLSITSSTVVVGDKVSSHTYRVKNVNSVYSVMR